MTPLTAYQQLIEQKHLLPNPQQLIAIKELNRIYKQIKSRQHGLGKWLAKLSNKPVLGLYLWGSVGVGKTLLMDLFYDCLPANKLRLHFHEFMRYIHQQLHELQGQKNPLQLIAIQLAKQYRVICFDEFFVVNIADAMILGELFSALFKQGLCLITSSNVVADDLYKNGLQREQFLPAIAAIKQNTKVLHLNADSDYRQHYMRQAGVYYTPLNEIAKCNLKQAFRHFADDSPISLEPLVLLDRKVSVIQRNQTAIWFDFKVLCSVPRSQYDFIELAKQYRTILISDVQVMLATERSLTTNFIHLIDVLYDHHTRLIISAEKNPAELYPQGPLEFEYRRTKSRLNEMRSEQYVN
ncbi:MAG: AFG1 family ATPase [Gammaproteobacteria bacterium]|nr:AFG1 family ATPase [Gammaproteobacteria bacterium]